MKHVKFFFSLFAVPDDLLIAWVSIFLFLVILPCLSDDLSKKVCMPNLSRCTVQKPHWVGKGRHFYSLDLPKWRSTETRCHDAVPLLRHFLAWWFELMRVRGAHCLWQHGHILSVCQEASGLGALHHTMWSCTSKHYSIFIVISQFLSSLPHKQNSVVCII